MERHIEQGRLARAVHLDCARIGDHAYRILGAGHAYDVDLLAPQECPCQDRAWGHICKHLLRAMMAEGDRDVLNSLRAVVALPGALRLVRAA